MSQDLIAGLSPADAHLAKTVLDLMGTGVPFADACKRMAVGPTWLLRRIAMFPLLTAQFQAARVAAAEEHFARTLGLADEVLEDPQASSAYKIAIDTHKWAAEKLNPTAYGPKSESVVTHRAAPAEMSTREKLERFRAEAKGIKDSPAPTPALGDGPIDIEGAAFNSSEIEEMLA